MFTMYITHLLLFLFVLFTTTYTNVANLLTITIISLNSSVYGDYIADEKGRTLYISEKDIQGNLSIFRSNIPQCYNECEHRWPPLSSNNKTEIDFMVEGKVIQSLLGTVKRTDGSIQITYNKFPLYYSQYDILENEITKQASFDANSTSLFFLLNPNGKINFMTSNRPKNLHIQNTLLASANSNIPLSEPYITDKDGITLYVHSEDSFLKSVCYERKACQANWPPLLIALTAFPTFEGNIDPSLIYWLTRKDGLSKQVTYNGMPLYYNRYDLSRPGVIGSQNKNANGGYWWILNIKGDINTTDAYGVNSAFLLIGLRLSMLVVVLWIC